MVSGRMRMKMSMIWLLVKRDVFMRNFQTFEFGKFHLSKRSFAWGAECMVPFAHSTALHFIHRSPAVALLP